MDSKRITQTRIRALLTELRSWEQDDERLTLHELSKRFRLEVWVVQSIAKSEGFDPKLGERPAGEEITEDEPETDPDAITGVYRQNPDTGEFERIDDVED